MAGAASLEDPNRFASRVPFLPPLLFSRSVSLTLVSTLILLPVSIFDITSLLLRILLPPRIAAGLGGIRDLHVAVVAAASFILRRAAAVA